MLRALIAAVLLTAAAHSLFDVPLDVAVGYSFAASILVWFVWPLLRYLIRVSGRIRRRRRRPRAVPTRWQPTTHSARPVPLIAQPAVTQINHHHYYCPHAPVPSGAQWADPTLLGLPQHSRNKAAHDAIYNTIDIDEV